MSCERETSVFTEMSAPQESDPKKTFRWRASLIHAKYKCVLSETGGGVFALSQLREPDYLGACNRLPCWWTRTKVFPSARKKIELFFNAKSARRNIIFCQFTAIAGLPPGWKPSICPLREEDFLFFPLSAEKKTQNRLMTGHSYEMFVHSKQSKAKRELLPRLTFQK